MIFIHLGPRLKRYLFALTTSDSPPEWIRHKLRRLKPRACPRCRAKGRFQGHGWRERSVLRSWDRWDRLWFWRVRCGQCGAVLPLVFDIVLPRLQYAASVVLAVIVGRLGGQRASAFAPHRRTQKRWLERFRHWWPVAQAAGAIVGSLESWARRVAHLREAVRRCASGGVWLVARQGTSPTITTPCAAIAVPR